jgi:hypothetical protein
MPAPCYQNAYTEDNVYSVSTILIYFPDFNNDE